MSWLFGSKTVSVSSTVYNLAGDVADRTDYLKGVVVGEVLSDDNNYLGETISDSLLSGPGIHQRRFYSWSGDNYTLGSVISSIRNFYDVDNSVVAGQLTPGVGETAIVETAFIEDANFGYFAEKYIRETYPALVDTNWVADYDPIAGEIIIQYEDTTTENITLTGYNRNAQYLIAYYQYVVDYDESAVVEGTLVENVVDEFSLPDTTGYALDTDWTLTNTVSIDLTETTETLVEYSDSTPDEYSTSDTITPSSYTVEQQIWIKETYQGTDDVNNRTVSLREIRNFFRLEKVDTTVDVSIVVEDMGGGVEKTTTTTVTTEALINTWSYRDDTQELYYNEVNGGTQMLIYKIGDGNVVFDAMAEEAASAPSEFFPFIPLRIENTPIDHADYTGDFYDQCEDAYKKMTGGEKLQDVIDEIEDNPDIADVDYATLMFGVSLNVYANSSRKYIYEFLKMLIPYQLTSYTAYENFINDKDTYEANLATYDTWYAAQSDPMNPLFGTAAPAKPNLINPQYTTLRLASNDVRVEHYDVRLSWATIKEETFTGVHQLDAKTGDVRLEAGSPDTWDIRVDGNNKPVSVETLYVYYQQDENTYTMLTCKGLYHENYVYDGEKVSINSTEALDEVDESGFLIPMHNTTLRQMSLIDSTQVSMENAFILFNSYTVTTTKWYETGLFKIVLAVAIAVATVWFAPAGAVTGGILGTNVAVGGAIGLTGTSALLVGAAANAIAAMALVSAIQYGATELLGEKWGGVVAVIAGFIAVQGLTGLSTGGQLGMDWGSMMRADNLIQLTQVGANAYSAWVRGDILEIQAEMVENEEEYEKSLKEISELQEAIGMMDGQVIDPMMFTDVELSRYTTQESLDNFINRTTMTGTDIIDLSNSMIYDYVEMNLTLPTR